MKFYRHIAVVIFIAIFVAACGAPGKKAPTAKQDKEAKAREEAEKAAAISKIDPTVKKKYEAAILAMRMADTAKAKQLLNELINSHPKLSGPLTNLGILQYRNNETELAEETFKRAIKVNPESAVSYNHLGIISRNRGDFKAARGYYEKALSSSPDYRYAHLNLGILLDLYIGELPEALKHYERYQELSQEEDADVKKWIGDLKRRIKSKK